MDVSLMLILFAIGFIGSFMSGMVGIGGAIINFPLLLYIPIALGFAGFTPQEVSSISAVQVFFATLSAMFVLKKSGHINKSLVVYMGSAIVIGSFIGGYGSKFLPGFTISIIYGALAFIASIMMFLPKKNNEQADMNAITFHKGTASIIAVFHWNCIRHCRCRWGIYYRPCYAGDTQDSNPYSDCHILSNYLYFLYRNNNGQTNGRTCTSGSNCCYRHCKYNCFTDWSFH